VALVNNRSEQAAVDKELERFQEEMKAKSSSG
jgi:hypothetical protein